MDVAHAETVEGGLDLLIENGISNAGETRERGRQPSIVVLHLRPFPDFVTGGS